MTGLWPSCYAAWFVAGFCIVRLDFVSDTAQHPLESRIGVWGCYVYRRLLVVLVALLYCTSARAADLRLSLTELSVSGQSDPDRHQPTAAQRAV